jgi:branched-chain amino acid transport system substrate-binding protein
MKRIAVILSIMLVASLLVFSGCAKDEGDVIKIGIIGPMNEVQGEDHWNGAKMAAKSINDAGGVKVGDKQMIIELVKADSNETRSPTDAAIAMDRLVNLNKVDFVLGGFRSEGVMAMQPVAMEAKKIFIGCGAASAGLNAPVNADYEKNKYWFRGAPFNSNFLIKTAMIHLETVADLMKKELGIKSPKIAIIIEKAAWADAMSKAIGGMCKAKGYDNVGFWSPSPNATDVSSELSLVQRADPDIIFTILSGPVGIPVVKQANELGIPAMMVGINVESQDENFPKTTGGGNEYLHGLSTYARNVEQNELTKPFLEGYINKYGKMPSYTADTYSMIKYVLVPVIEEAGSLDPEVLIPLMEEKTFKVTAGNLKFTMDHDVTWGPSYITALGVQWQNNELVGVWPNGWVPGPGAPPVTYKGVAPIQLPPALYEKYKK